MRDCLNLLTIGNSFTCSLDAYFPSVVRSAGCTLHHEQASFGGCELRRHWSYVSAEERDPDCRIYQGGKKLSAILEQRMWEVVTIQQASHESWRPECFHPYGEKLAAFVRAHAPQAELFVQQTWSYRSDEPRLLPGGEWGFDQNEMYRRLTENYLELARSVSAGLIPAGLAVQLARQAEGALAFRNYDPEMLKTLRWPDLPPQAGALVGRCFWKKDPETGKMKLVRDLIHLNCRGQYLQCCVWFAMLFGRPTSEITFVPEEIDNEDAAFLREIAQQAVDNNPLK